MSGNLTAQPGETYSWEGESQLKVTAGVEYTHDGDLQRTKKSDGKLFWYSPGGQLLAETQLNGNIIREFAYFAGRRIAQRDNSGAVYYYFADHLGSARVITDDRGNIVRDSDSYPFGGERVITNTLSDPNKFAGMYRDEEADPDLAPSAWRVSEYYRYPPGDRDLC